MAEGAWYDFPMARLVEAQELVSTLKPAEKAELLQHLARELGEAFPGIEESPAVCGGAPCIVRTRIPVWVLEQARRLGASEAEILRAYPSLRAEDLANAWSFVRAHRVRIEQQITDNETA
ncbi:MAG TPA: DUF433 domain-containing protein [Thermoanaerobaculia bacterium]|nr:DUF433 domain-containing protein [Thermoanaerobaculia bacterium]